VTYAEQFLSCYAAILIGHITGLACSSIFLSVYPSIHTMRTFNMDKQKGTGKLKNQNWCEHFYRTRV